MIFNDYLTHDCFNYTNNIYVYIYYNDCILVMFLCGIKVLKGTIYFAVEFHNPYSLELIEFYCIFTVSQFSSLNEASGTEISCKLQSCKLQSLSIVHEQNTSSPQPAESIILEKFNNLVADEVDSSLDDSCLNDTVDQSSSANAEGGKALAYSQHKSLRSSTSESSSKYPMSAILAMDSVARASALRKRITQAETMTTLSKNDCLWLFALCAAVDTPLDADTSAALRSLLRKCASLRAAKSELDDEVIMLNILATISGRYFGQSES